MVEGRGGLDIGFMHQYCRSIVSILYKRIEQDLLLFGECMSALSKFFVVRVDVVIELLALHAIVC